MRQLLGAARGPVSRIWQLSGAGVLPTLRLSGSAGTCQERLRRRLRRSSTLDRTCPKAPEIAAIGPGTTLATAYVPDSGGPRCPLSRMHAEVDRTVGELRVAQADQGAEELRGRARRASAQGSPAWSSASSPDSRLRYLSTDRTFGTLLPGTSGIAADDVAR